MELVQKSIADQLPDTEALAQAKKLAKTEEEKTAIRKAELEIAKVRERVQSKVDQSFLAQLKGLTDRADAIEKDIEDKPDASIEKLSHLTAELTKLEQSSPQISAAAKQPAELLRTRLKAMDEEARTVNDRRDLEEAITAACDDLAILPRRLIEYAEKFPQTRRSGSFRAVAADEAALGNGSDGGTTRCRRSEGGMSSSPARRPVTSHPNCGNCSKSVPVIPTRKPSGSDCRTWMPLCSGPTARATRSRHAQTDFHRSTFGGSLDADGLVG